MDTQLLEQLYYIGELVSVIAVIGTLIYVGVQVRQNTLAVKSSTLQNISENQLNVHGLIAAHGDLADIVFKAATGRGSDEGTDRFRFTAWMHTAVRSLENAFFQHREGALDERTWRALCRQYAPILRAGLNAKYWEERSFMYSEDFRNFVDDELLAAPMDENWKVPGS
jgi:hypothetical protein